MQNALSILALGDSYTIGEGVSESDRWIDQLVLMLKAKGLNIAPPKIVAQTGWTTGELLQAINILKANPDFDLVFLLIGVNNQYRGYSLDEYRNEFIKLLSLSISFAQDNPDKVYVLSIPDWGNTPFAFDRNRKKITEEIDAFNKVNYEEACKKNVHYINITEITRSTPINRIMLTTDGLHPSAVMYKLWAESIMKHLNYSVL